MTPPFSCHLCGSGNCHVVIGGQQSPLDDPPAVRSAYACTSREHRPSLTVVECAHCGLRALHPAPPPDQVEQSYAAVEDPEYLRIEPHRVRAFSLLARRIASWRPPPGKLLDVGCSTGLFVQAAREASWDAYGVEPSCWAARAAAERLPGRIESGFLRDAPYPPATFDVITAWDVVEHLTDPRGDLARMAELLRPGGWLFLSTMASDAFIARLLGRRWPWYMDMHRFYFTPQTLGLLLAQAGFAVRAVESFPHATSLRYVFWKLEPVFGSVARFAGRLAHALGVADRTISVNLGDFFFAAAQRVAIRVPAGVPAGAPAGAAVRQTQR